MSTKIPNGYCLNNLCFYDVALLAENFRATIAKLSTELLTRRMATICTSIIDNSQVGNILPYADEFINAGLEQSSLVSGAFDVCQRKHTQVLATGRRDPVFDLDCEVVFLPRPEKILCLLIAEQDSYHDAWRKAPGVEPYPYWNNTDRPDDISDAEWKRRGEEWDQALKNRFVSLSGFSCRCVGRYLSPPAIEAVLQAVPNREERIDALAREFVRDSRMQSRFGELWRVGGSPAKIMKALRETEGWMATDEGQAALSVERERLAWMLPPDITEAMVRERFGFYLEFEPRRVDSPSS